MGMKYLRIFWTVLIICWSATALQAQSPSVKTHEVVQGETLFSISRIYGVSVQAIQTLNLGMGEALQIGQLIQIPEKQPEKPIDRKKSYKVQAGDTWYGISKKLKCSVEALQEANKEVFSNGALQIGVWLRKPKTAAPLETERAKEAAEVEVNEQDLPDSKDEQAEEQELPLYVLHRIAKNESLEVLAERYGCSEADLIELNPELSKESEEGRYIIVPNPERMGSGAPSDTLSADTNALRISVLLPFSESGADTLDAAVLRTARNARMRMRASSFYAAVLMAMDSLSELVDSVHLQVYDTGEEAVVLDSLAKLPGLRSSDLLLGPLYGRNALLLDEQWQTVDRPVIFSPLSSGLSDKRSAHLVDLYPGTEENLVRMAGWISNMGDSLTLWAAGSGSEEEQAMRDTIASLIPDSAHVFLKKGFWIPDEEKGFESEEGVVHAQGSGPLVLINFSRTPAHLADLLQKAHALADSVVLLSVHEWPANVQKRFTYMEELSVAFPKAFHVDYKRKEVRDFVRAYRERFSAEPDIFAFHAWDCIWVMHQMWKDDFGSEEYRLEGLQSRFLLRKEDDRWSNSGGGLLYIKDEYWMRF
jgi:LysM repeat protein